MPCAALVRPVRKAVQICFPVDGDHPILMPWHTPIGIHTLVETQHSYRHHPREQPRDLTRNGKVLNHAKQCIPARNTSAGATIRIGQISKTRQHISVNDLAQPEATRCFKIRRHGRFYAPSVRIKPPHLRPILPGSHRHHPARHRAWFRPSCPMCDTSGPCAGCPQNDHGGGSGNASRAG